jgi:hypothetical protein
MHSKDKAEPFTDLVADSVSILYLSTSLFSSISTFHYCMRFRRHTYNQLSSYKEHRGMGDIHFYTFIFFLIKTHYRIHF